MARSRIWLNYLFKKERTGTVSVPLGLGCQSQSVQSRLTRRPMLQFLNYILRSRLSMLCVQKIRNFMGFSSPTRDMSLT